MLAPYLALLSASARRLLQYRAAALAGLLTQLFFGFVLVQAYSAFYEAATSPPPMSLDLVTGYIWLNQAMLGLFPWFIDAELRDQVRSGRVVYEFLRPVDLYGMWYARAVAARAAPTVLRAVPLLAISMAFLGLPPPAGPEALVAWIGATLGALLLSATISTLMAITLFWTLSGDGVMRIAVGISVLFSGQLVPLPLFPEWLQPVVEMLPFRGLIDVPLRLYLGHLPAADAPGLILFQLGWVALLTLAGRALMAHGRRRLVAQGG